jgi:hypothetical protein
VRIYTSPMFIFISLSCIFIFIKLKVKNWRCLNLTHHTVVAVIHEFTSHCNCGPMPLCWGPHQVMHYTICSMDVRISFATIKSYRKKVISLLVSPLGVSLTIFKQTNDILCNLPAEWNKPQLQTHICLVII